MEKLELHIHANTDCNLQCKHCYNNSGNYKNERMERKELYRYLTLFTDNYNCDIHLEGGELFLYPDVFEVLEQLNSSVLKHITITTNGTILNKNYKVLHILRKIGCLRISIEGHLQSIHEKIRNSSLETVLKNAKFYQKQGVNVSIRMTLNKYNENMIFKEGIPSLLKSGFKKIQVYEFQEVGRGKHNDFKVTRNYQDIFQEFSAIKEVCQIKMMLAQRHLQTVLISNLEQEGIFVKINEQEKGLSILANGDVTVCPWDSKKIIANFKQMTDKDIINFMNTHNFIHECEFCSKVVLEKTNDESKYL